MVNSKGAILKKTFQSFMTVLTNTDSALTCFNTPHIYIYIYIYIYICVCVCVCVCSRMRVGICKPLHTHRIRDKVKISNLMFSFSYTSWHTKVKRLSLLHYLPMSGERIVGFIVFLRENTKDLRTTFSIGNTNRVVQGSNSGHCVHFQWRYS